MKSAKMAAVILTLLLVLSIVPSASANQFIMMDDQTFRADSIALYKGELLLLQGQAIYRYAPDNKSPRILASFDGVPPFYSLLSDVDRLYGFHHEGMLYPLDIKDDRIDIGEPIRLEADIFLDNMDQPEWSEQRLIWGGFLYAVYRPNSLGGERMALVSFDLATGRASLMELGQVQRIAAWRDGKLLLARTDERQNNHLLLSAYDTLTGQTEEMGTLSEYYEYWNTELRLSWDEQQDAILYLLGDEVRLRDHTGAEITCMKLPQSPYGGFGGNAALLPLGGQRFALKLPQEQEVLIGSTLPIDEGEKRLRIYVQNFGQQHEEALSRLRDLLIETVNAWDYPLSLSEALIGNAGDFDVMMLESEIDEIQRLIDKGYLADLSANGPIAEQVGRMYPLIGGWGQRAGSLYLVPIDADSQIIRVKPALFAETGLEVPKTFEAYCRLISDWNAWLSLDYYDYLPISTNTVKAELFDQAMNLSLSSQGLSGGGYRFDTPLFRKLMALVEETDTGLLELGQNDYSFMNKQALMDQANYSPFIITISGQGDPREELKPLILRADADSEPALPLSVRFLAVSARTDNMGAALRYVDSYLSVLSHEQRVKLYPDFNEPKELAGIGEVVARYDAQIAQLKGDIEKAEGAEKTELTSQLAQAEKTRAEQAAMRYHLSPEAIADYRQFMEHSFIMDRDYGMMRHQEDIRGLFKRYQDGQVDLEQFIREADSRLRLMRLENQ